MGNPLLRLNPLKSLEKHHVLQHIYMFFLLALFGFTYIVDSFVHNLEVRGFYLVIALNSGTKLFFVVEQGFHFMKMSSLLDKNRPVEQATIVLFFVRWIVLPLYQQFSLYTLLQVCVIVLAYINAIEVLELLLRCLWQY